jgi:hypothetical protein
MNKYRNKRTQVDGHSFMSKAESKRYLYLLLVQKSGEIENLQLQPAFKIEMNGRKICKVILDFSYFDKNLSKWVYEDVKSKATDTPISRLKRKLVEAYHGITVTLIL